MERFFNKLGKNKLASLFLMGRPWNALGCSLLVATTILIIQKNYPINSIVLASISAFFIYIAGAILNDFFDQQADKVNAPYLALEQGRVNEKEALAFSTFSYAVSLVIATLFGIAFVIWIIFFIFLSIIYSAPPIRFVSRGILAQISLGFTTALVPAYAGIVAVYKRFEIPTDILIPFFAFFILFIFLWMMKDFKDAEGDLKSGKKSVVVKYGPKKVRAIAIIGSAIFFPLTVILFNNFFQSMSFLVISTVLLIFLLITEYGVEKNPERAFGKIRIGVLIFLLLLLLSSIIS